ncbi:MAG TPA: hypothetical protein VMS43_04930 [Allosphingosinicella sp.]|nr:hypothetical protein [Allosphingosinicella sp.]
MLNLIAYDLPILGVALLIGVVTARLAFRRPPDRKAEDVSET